MHTFVVRPRFPCSLDPQLKIFFLRSGETRILFVATELVWKEADWWLIEGFTKTRFREKTPALLSYLPQERHGVITYT